MRARPRSVWILITLILAVGPASTAPAPKAGPLARLEAAVASLEAAGVRVGFEARAMDDAPLLAHEASRPLVPASTMKLLTSACALEGLGPLWSTRTRFLASGQPNSNGVLSAPLHVEAGGDPLLRGEDLWVAIQALRARSGLRRIEGDVIVDTSLFSGPTRPDAWPRRQVNDPYDAPQGAFAVGYASTELIVRPGSRQGSPAQVELFPIPGLVAVRNAIKTGSRTSIKVTLVPDESGPGSLVLRGTIAASRRSYREWIRLADADEGGLSALEQLLTSSGVEIAGRVREGALPAAGLVALYTHESRPLAELVRVINKFSSNFGAEIILRHLSEDRDATSRSTERGLEALARCAADWGIPEAERVLRDGSGYARANRLSPAALVQVLLHASRQSAWFPEWLSSLPRAGEDGSLRKRLRALQGRVRAKTGSLGGVAALAGFAEDREGQTIAFSIILNGERGAVSASEVDSLTSLLLEALPHVRAARAPAND